MWSTRNSNPLSLRQTRPERVLDGCTLEQYAAAKKLDADFLKSLELSDVNYSGTNALRIPYLTQGGQIPAVRIRRALHKQDGADLRFVWRKGSKLCLYELWGRALLLSLCFWSKVKATVTPFGTTI